MKKEISDRGWLTLQLMILILGFRASLIMGYELALATKMIDLYFIIPVLWMVLFVVIKFYLEAKYDL